MKKYIHILVYLFTILLISSCATRQPVITLRIEADPNLHLVDGNPHTLNMCVYQLTERNGFNQKIDQGEDGLIELLECKGFDRSVATTPRPLTINPGKPKSVPLDRAENANYVAVVAGYHSLEREKIIHVFDIPVISKVRSFLNSILKRKSTSGSGPLKFDLYLGPEGIINSQRMK